MIECIGKTPLIELKHFSDLTGCRILGKAEFMNPGGERKRSGSKIHYPACFAAQSHQKGRNNC